MLRVYFQPATCSRFYPDLPRGAFPNLIFIPRMENSSTPSIASGIRDILVIGGIIAGVNWGVSRGDFGWLQMNPTPWLILPALIGARYGVLLGVAAGVATSAGISAVQAHELATSLHLVTQHHPFFFSSLLIIGLVAGEFHRFTKGRSRELLATTHDQSEELYRVKAELELCRETRHALQRHLAVHNATTASLDDDLRKIITAKPAEQLGLLLGALQQHGEVVSAALYRSDGSKLKRIAVVEPTAALPETLSLAAVPLASKALDERSIASVKDPLGTSATQPFLAAIPFTDAEGDGLLLVQDMPFKAFNLEHLARIDLILHWTFAMLRYRKEFGEGSTSKGGNSVPMEDFMALLGQSLQAEESHALPSTVIRLDFNKLDEAKDAKLEKRLLATLPPTAFATRLPAHGSLIVLLPFGGELEAEATNKLLNAAGADVKLCHYLVVGPADTQTFWTHIIQE